MQLKSLRREKCEDCSEETHLITGLLLLVSFGVAMADDVLKLRRIVPAEQSQEARDDFKHSQNNNANNTFQINCRQSGQKAHQ